MKARIGVAVEALGIQLPLDGVKRIAVSYDAKNMNQFIPPVLLPLFANHVVFGCVLITVGTLATVFSPLIKSKSDPGRSKREQSHGNLWRWLFWAVVVIGPVCIGLGTWLTIEGSQQNASAQSAHADEVFRKTQEENARANREINNKMQEMLLSIRAAKQEETRNRTEDKINIIHDNFLQWAEDFAKRRPDKQRQLQEAKNASLQKELQISSESTPLFSYIIRFVQEAVRAYSKQTGRQIRADIPPLPDNFYAADVNSVERAIHFSGGKAQWRLSVSATPPARDDQAPQLTVGFTNSEGRNGGIYIQIIPKTGRFNIGGNGVLPTPEISEMFGQYGLEKYEDTVRQFFQPLIEAQLTVTP